MKHGMCENLFSSVEYLFYEIFLIGHLHLLETVGQADSRNLLFLIASINLQLIFFVI